MTQALAVAKRSGAEIPVGAVLVKNGAVIASACQGSRTLDHAEMLAMQVPFPFMTYHDFHHLL